MNAARKKSLGFTTFLQDVHGIVEGMCLPECCYTGGFSLDAKLLGGAAAVTAVDLDEKAIAQAQRNANLNQVKGIDWVHTDALSCVRTMFRTEAPRWDVVVLDPPKVMHSREEIEENGRQKYEDLNGWPWIWWSPADCS